VFAFLSAPSAGEMMILLIVGVLLFGRDLPDVGRKLGRTLAQFRRGLQDFKDQLDRDSTIRDLRDTVHDTVRDVKQAASVPRQLADPATALRDLATDAMRTPIHQSAGDQPAVDQPAAGPPATTSQAPAAEAPPAAPAPDPATDGRRSD
jgi:sec-independent protein translocase protein TatA